MRELALGLGSGLFKQGLIEVKLGGQDRAGAVGARQNFSSVKGKEVGV